MKILNQIYQPIRSELDQLESHMRDWLNAEELGSIPEFASVNGGKRLRPALMFLVSGMLQGNGSGRRLLQIAGAVEMIHLASLVHDDVIDHAPLRRGKPTINSTVGEGASIIFGDYVYSLAFELISEIRDCDVFACITRSIKAMCQGELVQIVNRSNMDLSADAYIAIVNKKTASLFAAGCQSAAILADASSSKQQALAEFGTNLGIAYQIIDDCNDLIFDRQKLGKDPGQDLCEGDITLPMLEMMNGADMYERQKIATAVGSGFQTDIMEVKKLFVNSDALVRTKDTALSYVMKAKECINAFDDSRYKSSINQLIDLIADQNLKFGGKT